MKRTRNIARHPFGLILALVGLMSVATFVLEPVALARVEPSWIPTGSLNIPRYHHTATLLPNGKVLVVGGYTGTGPRPDITSSGELYDPATGTWSLTGSLNIPRVLHTTTLLPNGKVLVAGGITNTTPPDFGVTNSAELFDPVTGTWSVTGSLNIGRFWYTATLLANGKVLVVGGAGGETGVLSSAELYDPATGTWSVTGSLIAARYAHTATLLQNGNVLIVGGSDDGDLFNILAGAELYDPATGTWRVTSNLNAACIFHTATLLPNGKVLVAGGYTNSAELYDPATGTWSITAGLNIPRDSHTATLLSNGKVVVAAGSFVNSAELYDPTTGIWSVTANLNTARWGHTATMLPNGKVLVAGGDTGTGIRILNSAELYNFPIPLFKPAFTASSLTGNPFLAGGVETVGLARGPAFQLLNWAGALQVTRFVLNPDFGAEVSFALGNLDLDPLDEILVAGRETSGLARGPAFQIYDSDGTLTVSQFVLNPDFTQLSFSITNVRSNWVLVCGTETGGLARGPAFQLFDSSGNLLQTRFVLNQNFTATQCLAADLNISVSGDEIVTGGSESTGLARGPAFQIWDKNGNLLATQFVLNPDFTETQFAVVNIASNAIIAYGRETTGATRGPAYQLWDGNGNFLLTRFALNPDFTDFQLFGANTTNSVPGDEIITGGLETSGLTRGPVFQVWDKNGNLLFTRFVLNPDFTEVTFSKIDINNDGVDEILVVGRETKGLQRGPAFQLFDGNGNLLVSQFVLNADFTNLRIFVLDQDGDRDKEIGIGGVESKGFLRGPAYQIFESNGILVQAQFVLNPDF